MRRIVFHPSLLVVAVLILILLNVLIGYLGKGSKKMDRNEGIIYPSGVFTISKIL